MPPTKVGNVLSWASNIEQGTLDQAAKASRLPFVKGHLALMPDAHIGKGATIGSVIPTSGAIIPAAVGVDIGCGMIAVETDLTADGLPDDLGKFLSFVESVVPSGMGNGHTFKTDWDRERRTRKIPSFTGASDLSTRQVNKITEQFGTLGSGNHFVELCLDERDRVWVVLHSGSRGIGNQLAAAHISAAKGLMKERFITLEDPDLAYLVEGEPAFQHYIADMLWSQEYARANRDAMMDAVLDQLWGFVGTSKSTSEHRVGYEVRRINCHHNYTEQEHHNGVNVWLTRKGAIRARVGDMGVIPGSMGTSTFIVRGLGNPASYNSCSHGAGRRLSRGAARRELTVESLRKQMGDRVWNSNHAEALLDEHPDSYKNVEQVMRDQADLVEIDHTLHQIMNFKGS
jgi:tRNA-splicing ligase RtcB